MIMALGKKGKEKGGKKKKRKEKKMQDNIRHQMMIVKILANSTKCKH
jgi:hypothetical protein